jgi:hypothetical protein
VLLPHLTAQLTTDPIHKYRLKLALEVLALELISAALNLASVWLTLKTAIKKLIIFLL